MKTPLPPVPPLTELGFKDPVWARWLQQLWQVVNTAVIIPPPTPPTPPPTLGTGLTYAGGNIVVTGGPSMQAVQSATQTLTPGVAAMVTLGTLVYNNGGGTFSNSRYTPTTAGKYRVTIAVEFLSSSTAGGLLQAILFRNGGVVTVTKHTTVTAFTGEVQTLLVSTIASFNGTTDYVEAWAQADGSSCTLPWSGVNASYLEVQYAGV